MPLRIDAPVEHPDYDFLGHRDHAENLVAILLEAIEADDSEGLSIAVLGDWGSGKSTFMNLMKCSLKDKGHSPSNFVDFDAWKHEQAENIITPLVKDFRDRFLFDFIKAQGKLWSEFTAQVIGHTILDLFAKTSGTPNARELDKLLKELKEKYGSGESDYERAGKLFSGLIESAKGKGKGSSEYAFFFIDNLDRCTPENAIRLLESIKNFLSVRGCIFIFAIDPVVISAFIKKKYYKAEFGPYEYLEKIFPFTYNIPDPKEADIKTYCKEKGYTPTDLKRRDDYLLIYSWLLSLISMSRKLRIPRRINRILMRFELLHLSAFKDDWERNAVLTGAIWICIYEGWPELYLWARNNILMFSFLMKSHGKDLMPEGAAAVDKGTGVGGPVPDTGDLTTVPELFRNDESFGDYISKLFMLAYDKDNTSISGELKEVIKNFISTPNKHDIDMSITGIP